MSSDYSGNRKPFVLILRHSGDGDIAAPVLASLREKKLDLCVLDETGKAGSKTERACACVAFLSKNTQNCEPLEETLLQVKNAGTAIIPVFLDGTPQSGIIHRNFFSSNALFLEDGDTEALAARLMDAEELKHPAVTEAQKKAFRRAGTLILVLTVLVLAAAGVLIYKLTDKPEDEKPAEASVAEPAVPTPDIRIPANAGLSADDLINIRTYILAGDTMVPAKDDQAGTMDNLMQVRGMDGEREWILKTDGSVIGQGTITDFSFLSYMTNLQNLVLINQTATEFPDISNLKHLFNVQLIDCAFTDLKGISGCSALTGIGLSGGFRDISDLSGCERLVKIDISDCPDLENMDSFSSRSLTELRWSDVRGPRNLNFLSGTCPALRKIHISGNNTEDISGLASCKNLIQAYINCPEVKDLSPLGGCTLLSSLDVSASNAGSFSFLKDLTRLTELYIDDFNTDDGLDSLQYCKELYTLELHGSRDDLEVDLSFLAGLPKLKCIDLHHFEFDLSFLNDMDHHSLDKLNFNGNIHDFSGLASLKSCGTLVCGENATETLRYIKDTECKELRLEDVRDVDLSEIPQACSGLVLVECGGIKSLQGLKNSRIFYIEVENCPGFSDLGYDPEDLPALSSLKIINAPRLADYEPVYGGDLHTLELHGVSAPDFSRLRLSDNARLTLDEIYGIDSLDFLSDIPRQGTGNGPMTLQNLDISGLSGIDNLMPIRKGNVAVEELTVTPELENQAKELQSEKTIQRYAVSYPDHSWMEDDNTGLQLMSLSELDTLPASMLSAVRELNLAGDTVYSREDQWLEARWNAGKPVFYLEGEPVKEGTLTDLTKLSKLTGLETLRICRQPLTGLDGIRDLENLRCLELTNCGKLSDYSDIFALSGIQSLSLTGDNFTSVEGIQNFDTLYELDLTNSGVTDLSPLAGCRFPNGESFEDGLDLSVGRKVEDLSPLQAVPKFSFLHLNRSAEQMNNEQFKELLSGIPFVRLISLDLEGVTDLSPLLDHPELAYVELNDMREAGEKLKEMPHSFVLELRD